MKNLLSVAFQIALWPFPWVLRRFILKCFWGFEFSEGARMGFSVVLARCVKMGKSSAIRNFTFVKGIKRLELGPYAYIVNLNWITGVEGAGRPCELIVGAHSSITSRHFIDCTGGVYIGSFTTVGGARSQLLTHCIDVYKCRQTYKSVVIGDYCFIGTASLLLPGAGLPSFSVLGGGAVLNKRFSQKYALYAGAPAVLKKSLLGVEVRYFSRKIGFVR